jgi:HEAT repeat protein
MWQDLAKTANAEKPNLAEGIAVVKKLAEFGQDALQPVFDTLADKASSPRAKALATVGLSGVLDTDAAARLLPLIKPENDLTTRACATKLLTLLAGANVDEALNQLKNDPEHQVRFQAVRALASRKPEGRKDFIDLWAKPETTIPEKKDILVFLASVPSGDSLPIFQDVLRAPDFDEDCKLIALSSLGLLADPSTEPLLLELAEKGASDAIKTAAKDAIEAVNGRKKTTAALQAIAPKAVPAGQ